MSKKSGEKSHGDSDEIPGEVEAMRECRASAARAVTRASVTTEGPSCRKVPQKHSDEKILNPRKRSKCQTVIKIRLPDKTMYKANGFDQNGEELWTSIFA